MSAADIPADNPKGKKAFLANGVSIFFINGKPAVINGLRKFKNPPYWPAIFLVVPFNNIPLFSKDLITFIILFISLKVRTITVYQTLSKVFLKSFITFSESVAIFTISLIFTFINSLFASLKMFNCF